MMMMMMMIIIIIIIINVVEELYSLYRTPNIVRVIKSRRLRWAGYVARMEEGRRATEKRPLGRSSVDGRTILEWTE